MPNWVYDLINAVAQYEEEHGHRNDGWPCLSAALAAVPAEYRHKASAIAEYKRQQADAENQPS